ncbi:MAG: macrolide ABC transporter ATP-binding protein, partial [Firmicutes bacterium]|nr:macrolide ABC transporter ATP-binding protein [Bacillota bacterium]
LANNPSLLLADEPTGQLDTRSGLEVLALIQELHRATGATVIMVTHDPEVALFCRRVVRLRDGRVVGCEEVAEPADAAARLWELPPEGGEGAA